MISSFDTRMGARRYVREHAGGSQRSQSSQGGQSQGSQGPRNNARNNPNQNYNPNSIPHQSNNHAMPPNGGPYRCMLLQTPNTR